jgi:hypothetical protein
MPGNSLGEFIFKLNADTQGLKNALAFAEGEALAARIRLDAVLNKPANLSGLNQSVAAAAANIGNTLVQSLGNKLSIVQTNLGRAREAVISLGHVAVNVAGQINPALTSAGHLGLNFAASLLKAAAALGPLAVGVAAVGTAVGIAFNAERITDWWYGVEKAKAETAKLQEKLAVQKAQHEKISAELRTQIDYIRQAKLRTDELNQSQEGRLRLLKETLEAAREAAKDAGRAAETTGQRLAERRAVGNPAAQAALEAEREIAERRRELAELQERSRTIGRARAMSAFVLGGIGPIEPKWLSAQNRLREAMAHIRDEIVLIHEQAQEKIAGINRNAQLKEIEDANRRVEAARSEAAEKARIAEEEQQNRERFGLIDPANVFRRVQEAALEHRGREFVRRMEFDAIQRLPEYLRDSAREALGIETAKERASFGLAPVSAFNLNIPRGGPATASPPSQKTVVEQRQLEELFMIHRILERIERKREGLA